MERMLTPLKEWLNSVGIKTRAQISYGKPFEISAPIMACLLYTSKRKAYPTSGGKGRCAP